MRGKESPHPSAPISPFLSNYLFLLSSCMSFILSDKSQSFGGPALELVTLRLGNWGLWLHAHRISYMKRMFVDRASFHSLHKACAIVCERVHWYACVPTAAEGGDLVLHSITAPHPSMLGKHALIMARPRCWPGLFVLRIRGLFSPAVERGDRAKLTLARVKCPRWAANSYIRPPGHAGLQRR